MLPGRREIGEGVVGETDILRLWQPVDACQAVELVVFDGEPLYIRGRYSGQIRQAIVA